MKEWTSFSEKSSTRLKTWDWDSSELWTSLMTWRTYPNPWWWTKCHHPGRKWLTSPKSLWSAGSKIWSIETSNSRPGPAPWKLLYQYVSLTSSTPCLTWPLLCKSLPENTCFLWTTWSCKPMSPSSGLMKKWKAFLKTECTSMDSSSKELLGNSETQDNQDTWLTRNLRNSTQDFQSLTLLLLRLLTLFRLVNILVQFIPPVWEDLPLSSLQICRWKAKKAMLKSGYFLESVF